MVSLEVTKQRILLEDAEVDELTAVMVKELIERTATRDHMLDLVAKLEKCLLPHLRDEARVEVICQQAGRQKDLIAACEELRREHASLHAKLRKLVRLTEEGDVQPAWWDALEGQFHALSFELASHQLRENRLLDEVDERMTG